MINWQSVFFNSLWILALAILLSALSFQYWLAYTRGRSLRRQVQSREFVILFWLAVLLFGVGLLGTSSQTWEMVLWGLLVLWSGYKLLELARKQVVISRE